MARRTFAVGAVLLATAFGVVVLHSFQNLRTQGAPRPGAISGTVVDAVTGKPLEGAVVSIASSSSLSGPGLTFNLVTDSLGRFVVRSITQSGEYSLSASKVGYSEIRLGRTGAQTVQIRTGEWISNARIVMRPWSTISGRVLDERGQPLAEVPVRILTRAIAGGDWHLAAGPITRTDDQGQYRISRLRAGLYYLVVPSVQSSVPNDVMGSQLAGRRAGPSQLTNGQPLPNTMGVEIGGWRLVVGNYATPPSSETSGQKAYPPTFFPSGQSLDQAVAIDIGDGEERTNVNVTLEPVDGVQVSGKVEFDGQPTRGLLLRLLMPALEDLGLGSEHATTIVGEGGKFSFNNVPKGSYVLSLRGVVAELLRGAPIATGLPTPAGWTQGTATAIPIDTSHDGTQVGLRPRNPRVQLEGRMLIQADRHLHDLTLVASATRKMSGQIRYDGDKPLMALLTVAEAPDGKASLSVEPQRAYIDSFVVSGLSAAEYFLRFRTFGRFVVKAIVAGGRDLTDDPIDLSLGDVSNIEVTLTDKVASVSGFVKTREGKIADQATVIVFPAEPTKWKLFGLNPPHIQSFGGGLNQGYKLTGLPKGEYLIVAIPSAVADWQNSSFFAAIQSVANRISLDWGQSVVQDLSIVAVPRVR